jgi:hypothetical protein
VLTALELDLVQMRTEPAAVLRSAPSTPTPVIPAPNRTPETDSGHDHAQQRKREKGTAPVQREKGTAPVTREKGTAPVPPEKETPALQDEWGFFDPQQCGFSALLTKLDEISEDEKRSAKKRA